MSEVDLKLVYAIEHLISRVAFELRSDPSRAVQLAKLLDTWEWEHPGSQPDLGVQCPHCLTWGGGHDAGCPTKTPWGVPGG